MQEQTQQRERQAVYGGMFSKRNHMIKLRGQRSQGVAREWEGQSLQESKLSNIRGWGGRGLPGPNPELFTEFYVFWVLPGGSFPAAQ